MNEIDLSLTLQRFSCRALWHFTGYKKDQEEAFDIQCKILESSLLKVAKYPEPILMPNGDEKRWGLPVSCVCDIPFKDLLIHMVRYGQFGISFHKNDAVTEGLFNPVLYLHKKADFFDRSSSLLNTIEKNIDQKNPAFETLQEFLSLLGSYTKRSDLLHPATIDTKKDESQNNNFYFEREWRSTHDWDFNDKSIAAIMMPSSYICRFRKKFEDRFPDSSIISSELVETL